MPANLQGQAVATCFSGFANGWSLPIKDDYVIGVIDVHVPVGPGLNWPAPMYHGPGNTWKSSNLGQIYGIAIDNNNNIYATATAIYPPIGDPLSFGPAGSGGIYRLDGVTGAISTLVSTVNWNTFGTPSAAVGTSTIPNGNAGNNRPSLGNISFDRTHTQLFVTNFEDGMIYRINMSGVIQQVYDPVAPANPGGTSNPAMAADGGTLGAAPLGERIFGIQYNAADNRVYYSVWMEQNGTGSATTANIIRSVALLPTGAIDPTTDRFELVVPQLTLPSPPNTSYVWSAPISDIAFPTSGNRILLGERSYNGTPGLGSAFSAHESRVLEFSRPTTSGSWGATPKIIYIGNAAPSISGANSAGGVDYGYGGWDPIKRENLDCDSVVWGSGDALTNAPGFGWIYGLQRSPQAGNTIATISTTGYFIDLNGTSGTQDKQQIGDVEIFRAPCVETQVEAPCKDIRLRLLHDNTYGQKACCYTIDIQNLQNTYQFTQLTATVNTPFVTISNATAPAGWTVMGVGTSSTWTAPPGGIPPGATVGLSFCLNIGLVGPPQSITFSFIGADGQHCDTTVTVDCSPPAPVPGCGQLQNLKIDCKQFSSGGNVYNMSFQLQNQSIFNVVTSADIISVTPAVTVSPLMFNFGAGIPTNGVSAVQNLTISGPAAVAGTVVCLRFELMNADSTWCCKFDTCIVLPPCKDCCDNFDIKIEPKQPNLTHNGAGVTTVGSTISTSPASIIKMTATVVSASIKRFGNPTKCQPHDWRQVSGEIFNPPATFNGLPLMTTPQPFPTTPPGPYREVIWGTVPGGVTMTGVPMNLQIQFPAPPPSFWGCYDSVRFCVRYTFTDVNCVTCDTIICYQQRRTASPIKDISDIAAEGHHAKLMMSSTTAGALTISVPQPIDPVEPHRIVGFSFTPDFGVTLTSLGGATVRDNTGTVRTVINAGESRTFDLTIDNYGNVSAFEGTVRYRYVMTANDRDTLTGSERIFVRVPITGASRDSLVVDKSEIVENVRTYRLRFVAGKEGYRVASLRVTVKDGLLLAAGPFPEPSSAVLTGVVDANGTAIMTPMTEAARITLPPGGSVAPIYLTVSNTVNNEITIEYTVTDSSGTIVGSDTVTLKDPVAGIIPKGGGESGIVQSRMRPIFPNPTTTSITIPFAHDESGDRVTLRIYDIRGAEVMVVSESEYFGIGEHNVVVRVAHLPQGKYYVTYQGASGTETKSFDIVR